jgi:hypothetical protein
VVIAQLQQVHDENPDDPEYGMLYAASNRLTVENLDATPEHLEAAVATWRSHNAWLTTVALKLHLDAPGLTDHHVQRILADIPNMTTWGRRDAAIALELKRPDVQLPLGDPAVRAGHAAVTAIRLMSEGRPLDLIPLLEDADLFVRSEAARHFCRNDPGVTQRFEEALSTPAGQWTCVHCSELHPADVQSCPATSFSRPDPRLGSER